LGARRYDIVVAETCQDCFHVIEVRGEYAVMISMAIGFRPAWQAASNARVG